MIDMEASVIHFQRLGNVEELKAERDKSFQIALTSILKKKTPKSVIYKRPGREGKQFDYIQGWWIIDQLNSLFDFNWDWEIEDQNVGKTQVWVRGKLTVKRVLDNGLVLSVGKSAFGGAEIKRYSGGHPKEGEVLDIGNDLKAASTDAFKKAASLLGIAADIYGRDETLETTVGGIDATLAAIYKRGALVGMSEKETKDWCRKFTKIPFESLSKLDAQKALRELVKLGTQHSTNNSSK